MKANYRTIRFEYSGAYIGSTGNPSVKPYSTIWSQRIKEDVGYECGMLKSFGWIAVGDPKPVRVNQDADQIAAYAAKYPLYSEYELYQNQRLVKA